MARLQAQAPGASSQLTVELEIHPPVSLLKRVQEVDLGLQITRLSVAYELKHLNPTATPTLDIGLTGDEITLRVDCQAMEAFEFAGLNTRATEA